MSTGSRIMAAILLIAVPTVEFGGLSLLAMLTRRMPGYLDNPLRQNMFRAGHAHAGVIVILSLICQVLADDANLSTALTWLVRAGVPTAALLISGGFFGCALDKGATQPNGLIKLIYTGIFVLAAALIILGVGLLR